MGWTLCQLTVLSATIALTNACGSWLNGQGTISSPNYPQHYPNSTTCTWTLTANKGSAILLKIIDLRLESDYDYVYINGGKQQLSYQFTGDINGTEETFVLKSRAEIRFVSDVSYSDSGFQIVFTSTNETYFEDCGGELEESGNITSPNYPNAYPHNARCTWKLTTTNNRAITLRFISFVTESVFDVLNVYYGTYPASPYLYNSFSGYMTTGYKPNFRAHSASLVFTSDSLYSTSGFVIEFTSVDVDHYYDCGGLLRGSGVLTSPNFPQNYPDFRLCNWYITASMGQKIVVRILELDTEVNLDYLLVSTSGPSSTTHKFTGRLLNETSIIESKGSVGVTFSSDSSISYSGFRLQFETINTTCPQDLFCHGELQGSGSINFSNYECGERLCQWKLRADVDSLLSIRIIEISSDTATSYVKVFNETYAARTFTEFSYKANFKNNETAALLLLGPNCTVEFLTGYQYSYLHLEFESVSSRLRQDCDVELYDSGNITSAELFIPYAYESFCTWRLNAASNRVVYIRILDFNITQSTAILYVFNGSDPATSSVSYSTVGNYVQNIKLVISGPRATLLFKGKLALLNQKFRIQFESFAVEAFTACGGEIYDSGEIVSPNYPNFYPHNSFCTWRLRATAGHSIALYFVDKKTEKYFDFIKVYKVTAPDNKYTEIFSDYDSRPSYEYLEEYSNYFYGYRMFKIASFFKKPAVMGPNATVVFTSDSTLSDTGFRIAFNSINVTHYTACGGELFDSGIITSPNYPRPYPNNCLCTWFLRPTRGKNAWLEIQDFNTEDGYDFVYVFNSSLASWGYEDTYSGFPLSYYSGKPIQLGPYGTVVFTSDMTNTAPGFRIEFKSSTFARFTDCGGRISGAGNITSPYYPNDYPKYCLCKWKLTVANGSSVSLRIIGFNTEQHYDDVAIYSGTGVQRSLVSRYSGMYNSTINLTVPGPSITIEFSSDSGISASGFRIEYQTVQMNQHTENVSTTVPPEKKSNRCTKTRRNSTAPTLDKK